jgi:diguanylate cyclase (GGDEF)-like protein
MLRAIKESLIERTDQSSFRKTLEGVLRRVRRSRDLTGLVLVDLQDFNRIASRLGYDASDAVLMQFGESLGSISRKKVAVWRIGEQKFALILEGLKNEGHAILAANKIERVASEPIRTQGGHVTLDVAIGVALFPDQAETAEALLQRAELALASAREGESVYEVYRPGVTREITSLWGMENEISVALERDEFEVFYQPKIALSDNRPIGAEALMRWNSPQRGSVPPEIFIPVAERSGSIQSLTWFVLNTALRQSASWTSKWSQMSVAVNVTAIDIRNTEFVDVVAEAVGMWGGDYERLTLEITESAIVADPDACFDKLSELRDKGVVVSIDDFGTGYSALSQFKNIPADELKIDKSFVTAMVRDKADEKIVRLIVDLAHDFDIKVIAEGVEDVKTLDLLRNMGCDYAQGFLYDKPMPHGQFTEWLKRFEPSEQP